ncbi:MAG TPA: cellulase family glycosylhydrolase [Cyclobacteriaceae bacterium]|nr:cellulase family glycosylhydrolase [Cyclobacteriaceae bacterium]
MRSIVPWFLLVASVSLHAQAPFSKGVNLTTWFQASSPRQIQFTKYTKEDFERIKSMGCDVIRLPINLHAMTSGEPDYIPDPLFLEFLDDVVNWCEELHIHVILDNHTFDPAVNTDPAIGPVLVKVWTQMAEHYKDRSDYVCYEILNEPHGIADAVWGSIQQSVIDAIRTVDSEHYIVVGGAGWNSYNNLDELPAYSDDKLIYTFHFYDPFIFTHQGASWTDPSMVPLSGVPFPYNSSNMPAVPNALKGTWIEGAMNNYASDGTVAKVKSLIDIAVNFKNQRGVPVLCGEFGVYIPNSNNSDRVFWYDQVRKYLEEKNIPWTTWDYQGGFGLFEKGSDELFDYDLNVSLLESLGMNVPPQQTYVKKPRTTGFAIYDDYIGAGIVDASFPGDGTLDFYNENYPQEGTKNIHWTDVTQYNAIAFDFKPDLDLSLLASHDHVFEFWVKGNVPGVMFDIRFIDTKTGATDHPWRLGKTIDNTFAPWDDVWHKITIPLSALEEKGAYDNGWFPPEGKFDWKSVDRFEIVAEHQALTNIDFWFDDIRVSGEEVPYEDPVTDVDEGMNSFNCQVYPNPMKESVAIQFSLMNREEVHIDIYSATGQKIRTLAGEFFSPGDHAISWNGDDNCGTNLSAGLYIVQVRTSDKFLVRKLFKVL